jgi:NAD(P)-dependent dehydrogenase (short-subunit alcohol dehydrogenase family)
MNDHFYQINRSFAAQIYSKWTQKSKLHWWLAHREALAGRSRSIWRRTGIAVSYRTRRTFRRMLSEVVVVAAKSTSDPSKLKTFPPDPNSSDSTISTVEREIREAGGEATAIQVDTRRYESVKTLVDQTAKVFGRLDVVVYNSGAIWWSSVEKTPMKRFQLMQQVNVEGLYATVQACLPQFKAQGWNGRIIVVSPPIYSRFFRGKTAYAMGKVAMSVLTIGLAMDWKREGRENMAITSIWPATVSD